MLMGFNFPIWQLYIDISRAKTDIPALQETNCSAQTTDQTKYIVTSSHSTSSFKKGS